MFALRDGERIYLDSWNYNALLVIADLANVVRSNGGRVEPFRKMVVISNRSLTSFQRDCKLKLERFLEADKTLQPNKDRTYAIGVLRNDLERASQYETAPVEAPGQNWINFVYNGMRYSLSLDDNPFFEFWYSKTPVNANGEYSLDACCDEFDKSWLSDDLFRWSCSASQRFAAAKQIFDRLVGANKSRIRRDSNRVRVPNTYDGGYHYETIFGKERKAKIDF